jgi:hypothetical protein
MRIQRLRANDRAHHKLISRLKRKGELRLKATFYLGAGRTAKGWVATRGRPLPKDFCLDSNYAEITAFLQNFRESTHKELDNWIRSGRSVKRAGRVASWFDFSTIERITPAAALIFTSEFNRIRRISGKRPFAIDVERWHADVAAVFDRLGLFQLLGIDPEIRASIQRRGSHSLFILPIRSGDKVVGAEAYGLNEELAEVAIEVARSSASAEGPEATGQSDEAWLEKAAGIYTVLIEAMDNVINHAYPTDIPLPFRSVKRWWMTAAIDRAESKLTVAIFDQGVSIPVSLPHWRSYGRVKRVLRRVLGIDYDPSDTSQDAQAIYMATRVAASSTGEPHRGKGLGVMKDFIDECRDGRLRIVSRCGEYRYAKGQAPVAVSHPVSIGGTLIEWEVRL